MQFAFELVSELIRREPAYAGVRNRIEVEKVPSIEDPGITVMFANLYKYPPGSKRDEDPLNIAVAQVEVGDPSSFLRMYKLATAQEWLDAGGLAGYGRYPLWDEP